jgi:hypothetical protein
MHAPMNAHANSYRYYYYYPRPSVGGRIGGRLSARDDD